MTPKAFLIGGDWVSSTQSFEIKNPYTHEPVGSYFQAAPEQVERPFQSAHEAFGGATPNVKNCTLSV